MSQRTLLDKELRKAGFYLARSKNHLVYKNDKGNTIIVPNHNKINKFTFNGIIKQLKKVG